MMPRFEPTVNLGQVITIATFAVTLGGLVWQQATFQTRTEVQLQVIAQQVENVQRPAIEDLQSAVTAKVLELSTRLTKMETLMDREANK